jgi:hypothetical protein
VILVISQEYARNAMNRVLRNKRMMNLEAISQARSLVATQQQSALFEMHSIELAVDDAEATGFTIDFDGLGLGE